MNYSQNQIILYSSQNNFPFIDRLRQAGHETLQCNSEHELIEKLIKTPTSLLLYDLSQSGTKSYKDLLTLLKKEEKPNIPTIVFSQENSLHEEVEALENGADDYLKAPFEFEELHARMRAVLRRTKPESEESISKERKKHLLKMSDEDQGRFKLLEEMIANNIKKLEPLYDIHSKNGYSYPVAYETLKTENGAEKFHLDILSDRHCFDKKFFDKVLTCPFCENYNVNLRDTCTSCNSPQIRSVEMIHHYRCSWVAKEEDFKQGIDYVCPKCHKELKHIGVDYDKPSKNHFCIDCENLFPEPITRGQCRSCTQSFNVENAAYSIIHSYLLTQHAHEVVKQGAFEEIENNPIDEETGVYTLPFWKGEFAHELKRCKTLNKKFSLLLARLNSFKNIANEKGRVAATKTLKNAAECIKGSLRAVDAPGRWSENEIIVLLIESDRKGADTVCSRIKENIKKAEQLNVTYQICSFPENGQTAEQLYQALASAPMI